MLVIVAKSSPVSAVVTIHGMMVWYGRFPCTIVIVIVIIAGKRVRGRDFYIKAVVAKSSPRSRQRNMEYHRLRTKNRYCTSREARTLISSRVSAIFCAVQLTAYIVGLDVLCYRDAHSGLQTSQQAELPHPQYSVQYKKGGPLLHI